MAHLAAVLVALSLAAEGPPVNTWTGADPAGACKGTRVVKTASGKEFACVTGTWRNISQVSWKFSFPGLMSNAQTLAVVAADKAWTVPAGCTGSVVKVGTNPTSTAVVTVKQNGATVATVSIATNGTATWTCASSISIAVGDLIGVYGPATADATMADLALTLAGVM